MDAPTPHGDDDLILEDPHAELAEIIEEPNPIGERPKIDRSRRGPKPFTRYEPHSAYTDAIKDAEQALDDHKLIEDLQIDIEELEIPDDVGSPRLG